MQSQYQPPQKKQKPYSQHYCGCQSPECKHIIDKSQEALKLHWQGCDKFGLNEKQKEVLELLKPAKRFKIGVYYLTSHKIQFNSIDITNNNETETLRLCPLHLTEHFYAYQSNRLNSSRRWTYKGACEETHDPIVTSDITKGPKIKLLNMTIDMMNKYIEAKNNEEYPHHIPTRAYKKRMLEQIKNKDRDNELLRLVNYLKEHKNKVPTKVMMEEIKKINDSITKVKLTEKDLIMVQKYNYIPGSSDIDLIRLPQKIEKGRCKCIDIEKMSPREMWLLDTKEGCCCSSKCSNLNHSVVDGDGNSFTMHIECTPMNCCTGHEKGCLNRFNEKFRHIKNCEIEEQVGMGYGVIAKADIPKGEIIDRYIGKLERRRNVQLSRYTLACNVDHNHVIDAEYYGNKTRFINHCCDPGANCKWINRFINNLETFWVVTTKDIKKGQWLYVDYFNVGEKKIHKTNLGHFFDTDHCPCEVCKNKSK